VTERSHFDAPTGGHDVAMSISHNLLNQFLYEAWAAGILEFAVDQDDLMDAMGHIPGAKDAFDNVLGIVGRLTLPPVIHRDKAGRVMLSFGEAKVDGFLATNLYQITLEGNIGARSEIELTIQDGALQVTPVLKEVYVEVARKHFVGLDPEAVEMLLREAAPLFMEAIAKKLEAFRVPAFNLESAGMPGIVLGIDVGTFTPYPDSYNFTGDLLDLGGE
jgi:hypothetical protein